MSVTPQSQLRTDRDDAGLMGRRPRDEPELADGRGIARAAVRANDIRGRAGREVTAEGVRRLGLAFADLARSRGLSRIAVARDGRRSSPRLERALVAGLAQGGVAVHRLGLGPTPMLGFAVRTLGLDGGVMVTASHNPPEENGLKLLLGADRIHGEALADLVERSGRPAAGGSVRRVAVLETYVSALAGAAKGLRPLNVAWDCGNGACGPAATRLIARLPGRHVLINAQVDGRFPNHHPDPAEPKNLAQLGRTVREFGCELGIAFDGDGDRIGVVDETGAPLPSDLLLLFLACDLLRDAPGATVIGDVKCSRLLFEGVAERGGRPVIAPSGYVLIREAMGRARALLAGELSGHLFFAGEWRGVDDALYAAVRTLRALSRHDGTIGDFRRRLPTTVTTEELRMPCARAPQAVRLIARRVSPKAAFDPAMGLRMETPDGWWLLRASGTEAKLTGRCEAATPAGLRRLQAHVAGELAAAGLEAPIEWMNPP
jgi:phosphomannomutase